MAEVELGSFNLSSQRMSRLIRGIVSACLVPTLDDIACAPSMSRSYTRLVNTSSFPSSPCPPYPSNPLPGRLPSSTEIPRVLARAAPSLCLALARLLQGALQGSLVLLPEPSQSPSAPISDETRRAVALGALRTALSWLEMGVPLRSAMHA